MTISRLASSVFITLCLLLLSCQTPLTPGPVSTPSLEDWIKGLRLTNEGYLRSALSPDGEWLADVVKHGDIDTLRVISASSLAVIGETQADEKFGRYIGLVEWAPDSSAIAVGSTDELQEKCPITRVVIHKLDISAKALRPSIFDPPSNEGTQCIGSPWWSPNSSELAVAAANEGIFIINQQSQVEARIRPSLNGTSDVACCWWVNSGLFYRVDDTHDPAHGVYELRMVNPANPQEEHPLPNLQNQWVDIVSEDPDSHYLLLRQEDANASPSTGVFNLLVYNIEYHAVEQSINVQGKYLLSSDSLRVPFVAILIGKSSQTGVVKSLWFFDWRNRRLSEYGEIDDLIGWRSNVQGFMIIKRTQGHLLLDVVRP